MATKPYFLWEDTHAASTTDPDDVAVFGSGATPETAALMAAATTTAGADTAPASPELGAAAAMAARTRQGRNSSSGKQKQQQQQAGGRGANKKPLQRGLGVAELERLRCGGDPLRELAAMGAAGGGGGAQCHPLLHQHHHHHHLPASAFEAATGGARFCSPLVAPMPPPPQPAPACFLHSQAAGCQRNPLLAPEQQFFRDRVPGGFSTTSNGAGHQHLLLPALAPEHPSSQSTIWRPAPSFSSSSCLNSGHRCDACSRRMKALAERGGQTPTRPASPNAVTTTTAVPDYYSIYDLATAMATARQEESFYPWERKRGGPTMAAAEAPAKKEVREIEFFPAASAHHVATVAARGSAPDESEFAAPFALAYGSAATPQLDLSLRL